MTILQEGLAAVARGLRDFGYPDVTTETIAAAHSRWENGTAPLDVIEMFAVKEFDEHPDIFGKPKASADD